MKCLLPRDRSGRVRNWPTQPDHRTRTTTLAPTATDCAAAMDTAERKPATSRLIVNASRSPDLNAPHFRGIFGWNVAWMRPIAASLSGATSATGASTRNAGTTGDREDTRLIISETAATVTEANTIRYTITRVAALATMLRPWCSSEVSASVARLATLPCNPNAAKGTRNPLTPVASA